MTAHRRTGGSGLPAFVGLGIPRSDLSGWVILEPIRKLLGLYHDLETRIRAPAEAEIIVKDRAFPRVKKTSGGGPENQTPATE